jgi:regulator of sigma E protease
VLLAGPLANFGLAVAVFFAGGLLGPVPVEAPGIAGVSVAGITPGSPAASSDLEMWDVIVAVDGTALADVPAETTTAGGTAEMDALIAATDEATGREMVLTVLRGFEVIEFDALPNGVQTTAPTLPGLGGALAVVSAPEDGLLRPGDVLLPPSDARPDRVALRGVETATVGVTPEYNPDANEGQGAGQMGIGISPPLVPLQLGPLAAAQRAVDQAWYVLTAMVGALARMATGQSAVELAGPLGISEISRQAGRQGLDAFLQFMALLSINLGLINLLPIPALDGGRLLFIAAEAVRGRRVEPAREAVVHLIGFVLVIGLMAALTVFEVYKLAAPGAP